MIVRISYAKEADKFLAKNSDKITEDQVDMLILSAVSKIMKMRDAPLVDLKKMKGRFRGTFRIRKGPIRIIFSLKKEDDLSAYIHEIDFRGNVYK